MSHRPRNRQPRHDRGTPVDRRGGGRPRMAPSYDPNVPKFAQLQINTPVSVVLKADQPTGREVQGFIAEILTSGDHPRGVKVRLTDGRVGRVQRLASSEEAAAGTSSQTLGRDGQPTESRIMTLQAPRVVYNDVREDGYDYEGINDRPGPSLEDYIVSKPARKKKGQKAQATAGGTPNQHEHASDPQNVTQDAALSSARSTCPVCHAFEGDEKAVAHHVSTHFDET